MRPISDSAGVAGTAGVASGGVVTGGGAGCATAFSGIGTTREIDELPSGVGWKKPGRPVRVLLSAKVDRTVQAATAMTIRDMATSCVRDCKARTVVPRIM